MGRKGTIALSGLLALTLVAPPGGLAQAAHAPAIGVFQGANDARYALPHVPLKYAIQYYGWDEPFQAAEARAAWRHGTKVFVELQTCGNPCDTSPVSLQPVISGLDNSYLASFARQVRAFRHPVLMTFDHEMNGSWYPWGYRGAEGVTPRQWIAAWDQVTNVINSIAGHYVTWVWAPNIEQGAVSFRRYWPGHNVGWVGLDGYYWDAGSTWRNTYAASVRDVESVSRNRPFIVAEAGIPEADRNGREQVGNLIGGARSAHAVAVMYFDDGPWSLTASARAELIRALGLRSAQQPRSHLAQAGSRG